jgi:hypothetical protein
MLYSSYIRIGGHIVENLTPTEAAAKLGVTEGTLAKWRTTRRYSLAYIKVGGKVQYRPADLEKFLAGRTVSGTEAPPSDLKARPFTPKNPRAKKPGASLKQLKPASSRRALKA